MTRRYTTRTKFKMKHKNLKMYTIRLRIQRETTEEEVEVGGTIYKQREKEMWAGG